MKASIFCYSLKGKETARQVAMILKNQYDAEVDCFSPGRFADLGGGFGRDCEPLDEEYFRQTEEVAFDGIPRPSGDFYGRHFKDKDLLVSVGSVGICVRHIAPYVKSKVTDPAVIVIDELGGHVIPILSGHIGGANEITRTLAKQLEGEAVITTATDINGKFAVDEWAARNNMVISSMKTAKDFAAAILERDLPLKSDLPIKGDLPRGTKPLSLEELPYDIGVYITWNVQEPYIETLRLIPKCLTLGIGCRRGTSEEAIREAVDRVIDEYTIDRRAISGIASIDLKKDEEGLLSFAAKMGITPVFYTAAELLEVEGHFTKSDFVKSITGVDNVCERAALKDNDMLIVKKTAHNGVTVAVGLKKLEVSFE